MGRTPHQFFDAHRYWWPLQPGDWELDGDRNEPRPQQPGLGLGLATVKRIVETHGGAVGVESHTGAGCRFWIDLPRAAGPATAPT